MSNPQTNSGNSYSGTGAKWASREEQRQIWRFLNNVHSPDGSILITKSSGGIGLQSAEQNPVSVTFNSGTFTVSVSGMTIHTMVSDFPSLQAPLVYQRILVDQTFEFSIGASDVSILAFILPTNVVSGSFPRKIYYSLNNMSGPPAIPSSATKPYRFPATFNTYVFIAFLLIIHGDGSYSFNGYQCPREAWCYYIDSSIPTIYDSGNNRINLSFANNYLNVTNDNTARSVYLGPTGQITYSSAGAIASLGQIQIDTDGEIIKLPQNKFSLSATDKNGKTIVFSAGSNTIVY